MKMKLIIIGGIAMLYLAGCYTMLSHPIVKSNDQSYPEHPMVNDNCSACHSRPIIVDGDPQPGIPYPPPTPGIPYPYPHPAPPYMPNDPTYTDIPWWFKLPQKETKPQTISTGIRNNSGDRRPDPTTGPISLPPPTRSPGVEPPTQPANTGNNSGSGTSQPSRNDDGKKSNTRDNSGERGK